MYADDIILFSESADGLHMDYIENILLKMGTYCKYKKDQGYDFSETWKDFEKT